MGRNASAGNDLAHIKLQSMQFVHRGFDAACDDLDAAGDRGARRDR